MGLTRVVHRCRWFFPLPGSIVSGGLAQRLRHDDRNDVELRLGNPCRTRLDCPARFEALQPSRQDLVAGALAPRWKGAGLAHLALHRGRMLYL